MIMMGWFSHRKRRAVRGRRQDDTAVAVIASKLDQHIEQHKTDKAAIHDELKSMREESSERFSKLYSGIWRVALIPFAAIVAQYFAAHGFTLPTAP